MKKALSVLAAVLIAAQGIAYATAPAPSGTATITAASVEAAPHGSAAVAIGIAGAKGFRAMHVEVSYDASVLSVEKVDAGPLLRNAMFEPDTSAPGLVLLRIAAGDALGGDGSLATIRFKVLGGGGAASDVVVKNCKVYAPGEGGELISVLAVPGRVSVAGGVPWIPIGIGGGALLLLIVVLAARRGGAPVRAVAAAPGGFCPKCGVPLRADARFCEKCGSARS